MKQYFTIHGMTGFLIAVVGLLVTLGILLFLALGTQQNQAQNYYSIDNNNVPTVSDNQRKYLK
jgi:ABC-type antimicrobial peptide transport system permease subunit